MRSGSEMRRREAWTVLTLLLAGGAGLLLTGRATAPELGNASGAAQRGAMGAAQLVAAVPLPSANGEMCPWMPASAETTLMAAVEAQAAANANAGATAGSLDRPPLRIIRDTYPTYSAIALDTNSNELYLQDRKSTR